MSSSSPSIRRLAAPLVVSFWMRAALTLVDTIYAAFIGDAAVAGIGLTLPLEFLMIAVWVGLSTGLTSVLSRDMGAGRHAAVDRAVRTGWMLAWIVSPIFFLVGGMIWVVAPRLGLDPDVARSFQVYGTVLIAGSAFTTFWSIIPDSLVKAHQDTRSTMWAGIWTNVINISLNTFFVFVLHWGLLGIALSTVLGRIGGLVYALGRAQRHELHRKSGAASTVEALEPGAPLWPILSLAVPSSVTFALMAGETGLVNALLARAPQATETIAAYSIYYRMMLFAFQPVIATAVAMLPFAARRIGLGDYGGVQRGYREAAVLNALYCVALVGPAMVFFGPWLAERLTESRQTLEYTRFALRLLPLACLAGIPFMLCRPVFEAMQQGRPGLIMALVRYVVLTGPLAWLGMRSAQLLGQPPLYGLMTGTLAAGALTSAGFYVWLRRALAARIASA